MPVQMLELPIKVGGQQVRRDERRAHVDPGVLVDLAPEEAGAVRCPSRAGSRPARRHQGSSGRTSAPPSPQVMFLVSWKLKAPQSPDGSQGASPVLAHRDPGRRPRSPAQSVPAAISHDARPSRSPPRRSAPARWPSSGRSPPPRSGSRRGSGCPAGCPRTPGRAPRSTKALAVETKVNEGMMTSSPGPMSHSSAAISSAAVPEVVSRTRAAPMRSARNASHLCMNGPPPLVWPLRTDSAMYSSSASDQTGPVEGDAVYHRRSPPYMGMVSGTR